jgi:hypothetical protein
MTAEPMKPQPPVTSNRIVKPACGRERALKQEHARNASTPAPQPLDLQGIGGRGGRCLVGLDEADRRLRSRCGRAGAKVEVVGLARGAGVGSTGQCGCRRLLSRIAYGLRAWVQPHAVWPGLRVSAPAVAVQPGLQRFPAAAGRLDAWAERVNLAARPSAGGAGR